MELQLDDTSNRLTVNFSTEAELVDFVGKSEARGPLLRLEERLDEGRKLQLELRGSESERTWTVRVRQVFRSGSQLFGTMFDVLDEISNEATSPQAASSDDASGGEGRVG